MNEVKRQVLDLVKKVEAGINEYENVHKIIEILSEAVDTRKVEIEFAIEIDERLGLDYFC